MIVEIVDQKNNGDTTNEEFDFLDKKQNVMEMLPKPELININDNKSQLGKKDDIHDPSGRVTNKGVLECLSIEQMILKAA